MNLDRCGAATVDAVKARRGLTIVPDRERWWNKLKAYAETSRGLRVPRWCPWAEPARPAPPSSSGWKCDVVLDPALGQPQAYDAVRRAWSSRGGGVLCLPTGHGKTCVAIKVLCDYGHKALVVCHKTFLLDQWTSRLATFAPEVRVSRVQGPACDISGDVVLATVQTLTAKQPYLDPAWNDFGVLVFDECHHVAATVFGTVMFGCGFSAVLGLSATPDRRDGLGYLVEWFLGPVCHRGECRRRRPTIVKKVFRCDAFDGPPPISAQGTVNFPGVLSALAEIPERTTFVADAVRELVAAGHRVLVLSHRRGLCESLAERLADVRPGLYMGSAKKRNPVPAYDSVLIASWTLVSEGFDDPSLSAVVLATPAADATQAIGRVGRSTDGPDPVVVDVIDAWGPCWAMARKRAAAYV